MVEFKNSPERRMFKSERVLTIDEKKSIILLLNNSWKEK